MITNNSEQTIIHTYIHKQTQNKQWLHSITAY